jgi:hypothetical protein
MSVKKLKDQKSLFVIIILVVFISVTVDRAMPRIPEPDYIIYGLPGNDVVTVTLKVGGELISTYNTGDNPMLALTISCGCPSTRSIPGRKGLLGPANKPPSISTQKPIRW